MIKVNSHILSNGLRLVHSDSFKTSMACVNLLYNVGARDEEPEHTGIAHLMEHLMFSGSKNAPSYDNPLQEAGAQNNAWTDNDFTNFYVNLPAMNIETALFLESDRMCDLNLTARSLEVQKKVVAEEFKERVLNQPYGDIYTHLRSLAYKVHPYRWPTIGLSVQQILDVPLDYVRDFYRKHYAPNNAVLSIVGDVSFDKAVELTEKWFSEISRADVPPRNLPEEPLQTERRVLEVERDVPQNLIVIAFHIPSCLDKAYPVYDIVTDFLASGKSSRLNRLVRESGKFVSADSYVDDSCHPGLLVMTAYLQSSVSFDEAEELLINELKGVSEKVTDREFQKTLNIREVNHETSLLSVSNVALSLAKSTLVATPDFYLNEVERYRAVELDAVKAAARSLLSTPYCVLRYKAKGA